MAMNNQFSKSLKNLGTSALIDANSKIRIKFNQAIANFKDELDACNGSAKVVKLGNSYGFEFTQEVGSELREKIKTSALS